MGLAEPGGPAAAAVKPQPPPHPGPGAQAPASTTSFLTATTLIYAIGAGITAAAGTRLALQWVLVNGFELYSCQLLRLAAQH